jgi:hypothetical protein
LVSWLEDGIFWGSNPETGSGGLLAHTYCGELQILEMA